MKPFAIKSETYLSLSRRVSQAFSVLSAVDLVIAAATLPALLYFGNPAPTWVRGLLALAMVLVLIQAVCMVLVERARTWAGRGMGGTQEAPSVSGQRQPMQGKKGYRNFGPKAKVSRRELERRMGLRGGDSPGPRVANLSVSKG